MRQRGLARDQRDTDNAGYAFRFRSCSTRSCVLALPSPSALFSCPQFQTILFYRPFQRTDSGRARRHRQVLQKLSTTLISTCREGPHCSSSAVATFWPTPVLSPFLAQKDRSAPDIPKVYDAFREEGYRFFTMEKIKMDTPSACDISEDDATASPLLLAQMCFNSWWSRQPK